VKLLQDELARVRALRNNSRLNVKVATVGEWSYFWFLFVD
jgi:hypothetical protein